ncbi:MAG: nuclear transport factor 2 family protein [Steroidobacteraceae bacterium]
MSLSAELRYALDHLRIMNRYAAYAHAVDTSDGDAYADCYTEDGWTDISSFEAARKLAAAGLVSFMDERGVIRGRENLRKAGGLVKLHHLIGNIFVRSIEGDRAKCSAYFVVFAPDDGKVEHFGRYEDELVRCADGEWRLQTHMDIALYERDRPLPPLA